ncbi:hypothetical protein N7478_011320 [Penicillium angulare]|uniref:uncharacterized protein n=1 Tax=Penicillium angulare TaxID=116970 RepID=UPI002541065B|nr:uncharacterized protein N7478_011320 [Penicillium angulare]KAJ5263715.1 hypothetical protein N7478_011320 [Penicillium angulare]
MQSRTHASYLGLLETSKDSTTIFKHTVNRVLMSDYTLRETVQCAEGIEHCITALVGLVNMQTKSENKIEAPKLSLRPTMCKIQGKEYTRVNCMVVYEMLNVDSTETDNNAELLKARENLERMRKRISFAENDLYSCESMIPPVLKQVGAAVVGLADVVIKGVGRGGEGVRAIALPSARAAVSLEALPFQKMKRFKEKTIGYSISIPEHPPRFDWRWQEYSFVLCVILGLFGSGSGENIPSSAK